MRTVLAAILLSACAARAGAAEVVTLKDGSTLHGSIVGQTADGVELNTADGTLHIVLDRIRRIDYLAPGAAPLPGAMTAEEEVRLPVKAPPAFDDRRQLLSIGMGVAEPLGGVNFHSIGGGSASDGDLGVQFGAQYLYFLSPRLGVGVDTDYIDRTGTVSPRLLPSATSSVGGDTWLMLGILRYELADKGPRRPFVLVGAGGAWNETTVDARPALWTDTGTHETRRLIDDGAWVPAASVRLGMDFDLDAAKSQMITLEAGWTGLASAHYAATPAGAQLGLSNVSGPLNILSFTARYGWGF